MTCPSSVTTLNLLFPLPNANRFPCSRSVATKVLVRSWKNAGARRGSLTVIKSKRRGASSGVLMGLISRLFTRSRHMTLALPRSFFLRCSIQACPTMTVSVTRLSSPGQAVDIATSYLSSMRPRSPSRPCRQPGSAKGSQQQGK